MPLPDGEVERRVAPLVLVVEEAVGRRRALQQELHARLVAAGTGHVQHRRSVLWAMERKMVIHPTPQNGKKVVA